ncbi:MAG: hypothetical protein PHT96_14795 [Syntrophorhabdaceae bacterium]|nr:hypothetical protein [Syntrophorhabdaceae bacterium]
MTDIDAFGSDPQVRYMRCVFASLEAVQKVFLESARISPTDERLRKVREKALRFFERSWVGVLQRTNAAADDIAPDIYLLCLGRALSLSGFEVPDTALPGNAGLKKLVDEVLK